MNGNYIIQDGISNSKKHYLYYYVIGVLLLIFCISFICLSYNYLLNIKKEKQDAFIEGSGEGIINIIANDLKFIFDSNPNLSKTSLIKNHTIIKKHGYSNNSVIGNVLSVNRKGENIIVDLQPITSLVHSILNKNFFYKIVFNGNTIISNIEDREFIYSKTRQINAENSVIIKLDYRPTSLYLQKYREEFNNQFFVVLLASALGILITVPILFYFTSKINKLKAANIELLIADKVAQLNINYIKSCQQLEQQNKLPIILPVRSHNTNNIDLLLMMEEMKAYTLAYTARCRYKFELELISEVQFLQINFDEVILKQLIISLLYNILYFMRGANHVKRFSVKFNQDSISFIYDSFAANEEHMINWSKGLFQHLTNPYILDCQGVFQLIKNCKLDYKIIPDQGKNEIIIFLEQKQEVGRVIRFKS